MFSGQLVLHITKFGRRGGEGGRMGDGDGEGGTKPLSHIQTVICEEVNIFYF